MHSSQALQITDIFNPQPFLVPGSLIFFDPLGSSGRILSRTMHPRYFISSDHAIRTVVRTLDPERIDQDASDDPQTARFPVSPRPSAMRSSIPESERIESGFAFRPSRIVGWWPDPIGKRRMDAARLGPGVKGAVAGSFPHAVRSNRRRQSLDPDLATRAIAASSTAMHPATTATV